MKNIAVVGTGYVGLVTGTCFADLGNKVICIDIDERKIQMLRDGGVPIYEPGLEEVVRRNVAAGRLAFTTSYAEGLADADFVFIAVGTPSGVDGEADLQYVRMAAEIHRPDDGSPADHHQQEHGAGGHGRLGGRHHPQTPARAGRVCRRLVPGVPARRFGAGRFHDPRPGGAGLARPRGRREGGAAPPAAARARSSSPTCARPR